MTDAPTTPRWRILLTPRWLGWHLFAVAAVAGMIWLGDWQFRRAMAGNTLSWAYTFEWPVFAVFGIVFWVKTIRDELHPPPEAGARAEVELPAGAPAGPGQVTAADGADGARTRRNMWSGKGRWAGPAGSSPWRCARTGRWPT